MIDIRELIESVENIVQNHNLGTHGAYKRWGFQDAEQSRDLGMNAYGCADAANILYSIGSFPSGPAEREGFIVALQAFQDPSTGLFKNKSDKSHHDIHTSAHCIAALELFDARPKYQLSAFSKLKSKKNLGTFLDRLNWRRNPWIESHKGAGLFSCMALSGEASDEWQDWYFDWLFKEADPQTGLWRNGCTVQSDTDPTAPLFHHMAGSFHYLFVHEYAHRALPYPDKMIDTCIQLYEARSKGIPVPPSDGSDDASCHSSKAAILGREIGFSEIDWVYCLNRSRRQTKHRFEETSVILNEFAEGYLGYLLEEVNIKTNDRFNDLHWLFGTVCALTELQAALPGLIKTKKPLKLVLDRRPFI